VIRTEVDADGLASVAQRAIPNSGPQAIFCWQAGVGSRNFPQRSAITIRAPLSAGTPPYSFTIRDGDAHGEAAKRLPTRSTRQRRPQLSRCHRHAGFVQFADHTPMPFGRGKIVGAAPDATVSNIWRAPSANRARIRIFAAGSNHFNLHFEGKETSDTSAHLLARLTPNMTTWCEILATRRATRSRHALHAGFMDVTRALRGRRHQRCKLRIPVSGVQSVTGAGAS